MDSTTDINLNQAQCLKSVEHWGLTRIYNVCSDTVLDVPWSGLSYLKSAALGGLMFAAVCLLAVLIFNLWCLSRD